jgi:hypothetical protein
MLSGRPLRPWPASSECWFLSSYSKYVTSTPGVAVAQFAGVEDTYFE